MANYINSVSIKESTYGLKISAPLEKLIEELRANASQSGWVNLEIKKRKVPSEKGATHYMQVDEWKPNQSPTIGGHSNATDFDQDAPF